MLVSPVVAGSEHSVGVSAFRARCDNIRQRLVERAANLCELKRERDCEKSRGESGCMLSESNREPRLQAIEREPIEKRMIASDSDWLAIARAASIEKRVRVHVEEDRSLPKRWNGAQRTGCAIRGVVIVDTKSKSGEKE